MSVSSHDTERYGTDGPVRWKPIHQDPELEGCTWDDDCDVCPTVLVLPHQCDDWVIGGGEEARKLIVDLQELIG